MTAEEMREACALVAIEYAKQRHRQGVEAETDEDRQSLYWESIAAWDVVGRIRAIPITK